MKIKWFSVFSLLFLMTSCGSEYKGDGTLTRSHGLLWTPIYNIQMPRIDISKPQIKIYDLSGIPPVEFNYAVSLTVPSSGEITPAERASWGNCRFEFKKNGMTVKTITPAFCEMINWQRMKDKTYLNGLYTMSSMFKVSDTQEHWELVFETPGFHSPEPVWAYIYLQYGGK